MAIKWRLRRVLTMSAAMFVCIMLYRLVTEPYPSEKTLVQKLDTAAKEITYINRPMDLSSPIERKLRLERIKNACASSPDGDTMNILVYERKPSVRMSYCVVPKAGCTFWIRMFRFLNNDTGGTRPKTPFHIDRMLAHDTSRRTMKMYRLQNQDDRLFIENSTRFMFARDPFTRVWSAYVDKLLLPNMWSSTGKEIVRQRPGATARSLLCGNDVTFREFVEFIVHQSETRGASTLNGHWRPVQYACDPCQFKPDFVGKQETFMDDTKAILSHFHLDDLLRGYDKDVHVRDEINILTDFNFDLLRIIPPECVTAGQLSHLLWAAFQLNGYLSPFRNASVLGDGDLDRAAFKRSVFGQQEQHWEEIQQAAGVYRRRSVVEAYRALPLELLHKFIDVYRMDFEYFGYDKRPLDIFSLTKSTM